MGITSLFSRSKKKLSSRNLSQLNRQNSHKRISRPPALDLRNFGNSFAEEFAYSDEYMMTDPINPEQQLPGATSVEDTSSSAQGVDLATTSSNPVPGVDGKMAGSMSKLKANLAKASSMLTVGHHGKGDDSMALTSTTDRSSVMKPRSLTGNEDKNSSTSGSLDHVLRTNKGDVYGKTPQRDLNLAHQLARHKRNITPRSRGGSLSGTSVRRSVSQSTGSSSNGLGQSSTHIRSQSAVIGNMISPATTANGLPDDQLRNTEQLTASKHNMFAVGNVAPPQIISAGPSTQSIGNIGAGTIDQSVKSMATAGSQSSLSTSGLPLFANDSMSNGNVYSQDQQGEIVNDPVLSRIDEGAISEDGSSDLTIAEAPEVDATIEQINDTSVNGNTKVASGSKYSTRQSRPLRLEQEVGKKGDLERALATIESLNSKLEQNESYIQGCHDRFDQDDDLIERLEDERREFRQEALAANSEVTRRQKKISELEEHIQMVARDRDNDRRSRRNIIVRLEREKKELEDDKTDINQRLLDAASAAKDAVDLLNQMKSHFENYKKKCELEADRIEKSNEENRKTCDEMVEFHKKSCETAITELKEKHNARVDLLSTDYNKKVLGYKSDCEKKVADEKLWALAELKVIEDKKDATLAKFEKECRENVEKERKACREALKRTDAKQATFFEEIKEDHKLELEREQEKTAAALKKLDKLKSEHETALKEVEESKDIRDNYDFYRSYFIAQQAVYRQHNFGNWDHDAQERIEAAGGVYVRPEGMPLRNSEMSEFDDYGDDSSVEIIDGGNTRVVNLSTYKAPGNDGGGSHSGGVGA